MSRSPLQILASLPETERVKILGTLTPEQRLALRYRWRFLARPNQIAPPGNWRVCVWLAGRGFGKTRIGAEWTREQAGRNAGSRGGLAGRTAADVRDVMVEGESGILACSPPDFRPIYEPSKRRLTWPNGSIATCYSADEPNLMRGPQHHWIWADELGAWKYADAWDQLMFGLRLGENPRAVVTTTPRPIRVLRELLASPHTVVVRGSTYENRAHLPEAFLSEIIARYEGTTLGRQELHAELLSEMPGALWLRTTLDACRVTSAPPMRRIVVAIDPATSASESSDETGIIVAGLGEDKQGYVLTDLSCRESPDGWARRAVGAYRLHKADRIVAEVNQGGDMVERVLRTVDDKVAYTAVHASKSKRARAEPIAALYEQKRIHHVGVLSDLEDQLCNYVPGVNPESPDRLDALVWAMTELMETTPIDKLDVGRKHGPSGWRI